MKRGGLLLLLTLGLGVSTVVAPAWNANAREGDEPAPSLQATSTVPVADDRVAALWQASPDVEADSGYQVRRECTVAALGDSWWVTANHCVAHNVEMLGFVKQSDGQAAGIAAIYLMSAHDDVALIKTGDGISAEVFELPSRSLVVGEQAQLIGYGATNDFASRASILITATLTEFDFENARYTDLVEARSVTDSRTCNGDSGGPVFINDTIYAVHTAGGYNPDCVGGEGKLMWHTDLASRVDWITTTMGENSGLSEGERLRAQHGRRVSPAAPSPAYPQPGGGGSAMSTVSFWGSSR